MIIYTGKLDNAGPMLEKMLACPNDPVLFSCEGTSAYEGFAVVDFLEANPRQFVATSLVASGGLTIVVASGPTPVCTSRARFLAHRPWGSGCDEKTAPGYEIEAHEMDWVDKVYFDILGKHTKKPAKWWRAQCRDGPFCFGARKAVELGVVSEVI